MAQVALKTILGFKDEDISAPMLARCSRLFRDWLNGLFSYAVDLPGFSAPSTHISPGTQVVQRALTAAV